MRVLWVVIVLFILTSCKGWNHADNNKNVPKNTAENQSELIAVDTIRVAQAPSSITRSMIQDEVGHIWFATFEGVYKYDGSSFTNITKTVSSSRFFSALQDRQKNLWFGSIGSGVFMYDGRSFENFTTDEGLLNNEITCIYEDKKGNLWFGSNGGASRFDGKSMINYKISGDTMIEDNIGIVPPLQRPINEVNSIIEDHVGNIWIATRGNTLIYDGKKFNVVTLGEKPLTNVRWMIKDQKGNIWLGGQDGLWRHDGMTYENITKNFVGYIYEDKKGNVWTSSEKDKNNWALSYYDVRSLNSGHPSITDIKTGEGMFFGILEDIDGNIWCGTLDGVCQYHGTKFSYYRSPIGWN